MSSKLFRFSGLSAARILTLLAFAAVARCVGQVASAEPTVPTPLSAGNSDSTGDDSGITIARLSWRMKSFAPTPEKEFEDALSNTKAHRESVERMKAVLAGEESLFEAARLNGQQKIDFLEHAARSGAAAAASMLGDLLDTGELLQPDPVRAFGYYRAGALGGRMDAAHNLGAAYARGRVVRRDYAEALAWLIVARVRGDRSGGDEQLRRYLLERQHQAVVNAAAARARELQPKHSREEIVAALPAVAPLTFDAAATSLENFDTRDRAAGSAAADATPPVVVITITGARLTWPSLEELQRAAYRGEVTAMDALGRLLVAGKLLPADPLHALVWLERSAALGDADAAYQLAGLYSGGEGIVADDAKAFSYYLKAAKDGVLPAIVNAGVFLANGRGTERDPVNGLAWLIVAKHYGIDSGQEGRLRAYLAQHRPADVSRAEAMSVELIGGIEARIR